MAAVPSDSDFPRAEVESRVRAELGARVVAWSDVGGSTNNRLFRLDLAEGPPLLAKFYARDRWNRLGTEFPALAFLAERGVAVAPRPYVRDDDRLYGVYSFEAGRRKAPADVTPADARAAAILAATLHGLVPADASPVGPANAACFSVADHLRLVEARVGEFEAFLSDPTCYPEVRDLARVLDLRAAVQRLVGTATAGLTPDQIDAALPRSSWRLNTYDFGPHNWLFGDDGRVTVVDFEGAGWDDPARMVMGCVSHPGSDGLTPDSTLAFLDAYAAARGLSLEERRRYERVGVLYDAEWATVYAAAMTSQAVEPKRFGTVNFDLSAHMEGCIGGLRRRLARAEAGRGYRFSEST